MIHIAIHIFYASVIRCATAQKGPVHFSVGPKLKTTEFPISISLPPVSFKVNWAPRLSQTLCWAVGLEKWITSGQAQWLQHLPTVFEIAGCSFVVLSFCLPAWALWIDNSLCTTPHPSTIWFWMCLYPWALVLWYASLPPHFASSKPLPITLLSSALEMVCLQYPMLPTRVGVNNDR